MTLAEAVAAFTDHLERSEDPASIPAHTESLRLLRSYFPSPAETFDSVTPARLRDFISRWFVENIRSGRRERFKTLIKTLRQLFEWAGRLPAATRAEYTRLLGELEQTVPRAIEITEALSKSLADRRGAFGFSEFLTSFEDGGRSQYDLDLAGEPGAIDSYFRILRVEGPRVEAEDLISGGRVWPVIFPEGVAALLGENYIINLEVVSGSDGWHISSCGFTYPPGTEV